MKQATAGFPLKQLEEAVPPEAGAWAVMKAKLSNADGALVYCVGHRRGEAIHTYIATHGSTRRGKDQKHCETGSDGNGGHGRKCPRILNDWTQAQPHIDKNNRWRQFELAIEERFRTKCFPFRLFTTVIAGMSIANAWALYQYHVSASEYDTFLEFVHDVAYAAITNTYDADHPSSVPRGMNCAPFGTPSLTSSRLSTTSTSIGVSASQLEDSHVAVSIRLMAGWKGKTQQRCSECNAPTSYCCAGCSTHDCIVPIHPSEVSYRGVTKKFGCLARHKRHPDISRRTVRSVSRSIGKKRR